MSKKTQRRHKRHRTYKKHRIHKKHKTHRRHTRRYLYRKNRQIFNIPGSQGVPLFSVPEKNNLQKILINQSKQSGNMIIGLRNM